MFLQSYRVCGKQVGRLMLLVSRLMYSSSLALSVWTEGDNQQEST